MRVVISPFLLAPLLSDRSIIEVNSARAALAAVETEVKHERLEELSASADLSAAMGTDQNLEYQLAEAPAAVSPPGELIHLIELAYIKRPDLASIDARRQAAEAEVRFTRSLRGRFLA